MMARVRVSTRKEENETHLFTGKALTFLRQLKRNNSKKWFDAHRAEYEAHLKAPCRSFVDALRPVLTAEFPGLRVDAKAIHRINRDTRFSADKSPYKTWVGFLFRDLRSPGEPGLALYLGMDPTGLALGGGVFSFSKPMREHFRERITTDPWADSFGHAMRLVKKAGFEAKGRDLKKVPAGYDPEHPHVEFLLHNGLYVTREVDMPEEFYTGAFPEYVTRALKPLKPFFEWMREMARSSPDRLSRFR